MGYDATIYRTREKEISIKDDEVQANEVLCMSKAYWLGNAIQKQGTNHDEDFIYLTPYDLQRIIQGTKECLQHKEDTYYTKKHFGIGYLSSYEEMVIYPQMAYFNQVMCNLLRNRKELHYWYLKY